MINKFWIWLQMLFKDYASCKVFKLKNLASEAFNIVPQGMAVYQDRYIFQGSDYDGKSTQLFIIDMKEKKIISIMDMNFAGHINNINIGPKYSNDDEFPLLYISECKNQHRCFVVRIFNDFSGYELVQTIKFNSKKHYGQSKNAFDWAVGGSLYTFGMTDVPGEIEIIQFPYVSGKGEHILTDKYILDSFKIGGIDVYQGTCIDGCILYALSGLDTKECPTYLNVIDLRTRSLKRQIPIKGLGEIESLGRYKDGFLTVDCNYNPTYTFIKLKNT